MILLNSTDYFQIKTKSMIADYDYETLINLYQPIIGYAAVSVYFTFSIEAKLQKILSYSSHSQLLLKLNMNTGDFVRARKKLEGIGLLKTYVEKNDGVNIYHYELYAPHTPQKFFDNTLYYGLLIKSVGEKEAERIKSIYLIDSIESNNLQDISSSFGEEFHPNLEDSAFLKAINSDQLQNRQKGKINSEFSYELFFEALASRSQISSSSLTKKELKEIERLSTLYGLDEDNVADIVIDLYRQEEPKGKRIDLNALTDRLTKESSFRFLIAKRSGNNVRATNQNVSSDSDLANKINYFEKMSPNEFLYFLQNGVQPAEPDLRLINQLSTKFNLTNPVINVLIDYVLGMNNNILSKAYCEKVAASLVRENVQSALDAMNYFKRTTKQERRKNKKSVNHQTSDENNSNISDNNVSSSPEEKSDLDKEKWEEMIKKIKNGN